MRVRITINDQGIVEFTGWDAETGRKIGYIPVVRPSILSQQQVEQERSRIAAIEKVG